MNEIYDFRSCFIVVTDEKNNQHRRISLTTTFYHAIRLGVNPEGGRSDESNHFVVCLQWHSLLHGAQSQLTSVEYSNSKDEAVDHERLHGQQAGIVLFATRSFIGHYRLDTASPSYGFRVRRIVDPVSISSATIAVHDHASYERLCGGNDGSAEWTTSLLLSACQRPVVIRRTDVILLVNPRSDGNAVDNDDNCFCTVLDCEPVDQGVLVPSTTLTIVEIPRMLRGSCISTDNERVLVKRRRPDFVFFLVILSFTTFLLSPVRDFIKPSKRVVKLLAIVMTLLNSWKLKFRVRILARNPIRIDSRLFETLDPFQVVFVSSNVLRRHALPDFSWSLLSLSSTNRSRLAMLCSIERSASDLNLSEFEIVESDDGICYVTPLLWFNLNGRPSTLVQPDTNLIVRKYFGINPPFAKEIHISLIHSPCYGASIDCSRALNSYFKIPRIVCQGDVFCLQIEDPTIVQQQSSSHAMIRPNNDQVYFHVSKIEGHYKSDDVSFLVDNVHSSLYQDGTSQSYIPNTMDNFWSLKRLHPIWESPMPAGFHPFCVKFTQTVFPYLKSTSLRKATPITICLIGPRGSGKMTSIYALIKLLNLHAVVVNCWELIGDSVGATASRIQTVLQKESRIVFAFKESLLHLSELCQKHPVIIIGTTTDSSLLGTDLASLFMHLLEIPVCDTDSRFEILGVFLSFLNVGLQVSISSLVQKTSGFVLDDLCALINRASVAANRRIAKLTYNDHHLMSTKEEFDICLAGPRILNCDFDEAITEMQAALSDAIGAPKIPNVKWEDIGGLDDVKAEILDTVQLPLQHPELLATGMIRSGVLLYGPPGTGKTLLAKAVATECSLNFLSVKGPELINMYVGQSEENVRKIFHAARSASPCIIFFDELDSLAPNRGRSGDSGGVMDRVVSQLLAEMDGLHRTNDVFVMGATNRPDLLDPALLRPGRFDKSLYVGICTEKSSRLKILTALTRKFNLADDVNLDEVVDACPSNLTGADFYALCSDAVMNAISRAIDQLKAGTREADNGNILVNWGDFHLALENLTPSVSDEELHRYDTLMQKMK